jgi:hypothetical protein
MNMIFTHIPTDDATLFQQLPSSQKISSDILPRSTQLMESVVLPRLHTIVLSEEEGWRLLLPILTNRIEAGYPISCLQTPDFSNSQGSEYDSMLDWLAKRNIEHRKCGGEAPKEDPDDEDLIREVIYFRGQCFGTLSGSSDDGSEHASLDDYYYDSDFEFFSVGDYLFTDDVDDGWW